MNTSAMEKVEVDKRLEQDYTSFDNTVRLMVHR